MQTQRNSVRELDDAADTAVLRLLLGDARPWSVSEVVREVGHPAEADDAIARLYGSGLVHRLGDFVFATRAAIRAAELAP